MKVKKNLKIITFLVSSALIIFSAAIYYYLQNYQQALRKTDVATRIVVEMYERRLITDDYILNPGERSKSQWFIKEAEIKKIVSENNDAFSSPSEKVLILSLEEKLEKSQAFFQSIIDEREQHSTSSTLLQEKNTQLVSALSLTSQESIADATDLYTLNKKSADDAFQKILFLFSDVALLFLALLLISFVIIWRSENKLEKTNLKLLELDKLKDEFVSIASHELRTPMGAIKSFVSMIFAGDYGPVNKGLEEPLADIRTSTERLINLVNDLLNLARIDAGRMKFALEEIQIGSEIKEIVNILGPLAKEKGITLKMGQTTTEPAQADAGKVKQVLNNLIGNALKFTDKGGITVAASRVGEFVEVSVTDTGVGISKEDQAVLFRKFSQISSKQEGRSTGTGLGLYISQEMIAKMGGKLWIKESTVGKGTTFAFTLPLVNSEIAKKMKADIEKEAQLHPDQK